MRGAFVLSVLLSLGSVALAQTDDGSVRVTADGGPAPDGVGAADDGGTLAASPAGELRVATKHAPPFVFRGEDGGWSGISIALWEALAADLGLDYRLEEATLAEMIDGVAEGRFDASIAAMTITPARERRVDFSHPFHTTGFGIAVPRAESDWWQMTKSLLSLDFLKAIGLLSLLLGAVGLCFWLVEHRRNPEEFDPRFVRGLGDGFWFSAVTMTTVGYGDMAPRTAGGRIVALIWMFTAILIISTFTGMIASSLTADRLRLEIGGVADLDGVRTGSVEEAASGEWLATQGLEFDDVESVEAGLEALEAGRLDAFVYDRPLLRHLLVERFGERLELVPGVFGRQDYGIALPSGSALREPLNHALLTYLDSPRWSATLTRYLGQLD